MWEPSIEEREKIKKRKPCEKPLSVARSSFRICLKARIFVCVLKRYKIR